MSIIFKTGISFNSTVLKFGQNISSHTVNLNASQLIFGFNVTTETFNFTGRLISQQASLVHITLDPVKINVHYISTIDSQTTTRTSMNIQPFSVTTVSPVTTIMNTQPFSAPTISSVTLTMSTQPFSAAIVSSVTITSSISSFSLLPVIGGVVGAIVIIAIIVIIIAIINVYFCGIHKGKQTSVNSNHQEMTTLSNQPCINYNYI